MPMTADSVRGVEADLRPGVTYVLFFAVDVAFLWSVFGWSSILRISLLLVFAFIAPLPFVLRWRYWIDDGMLHAYLRSLASGRRESSVDLHHLREVRAYFLFGAVALDLRDANGASVSVLTHA